MARARTAARLAAGGVLLFLLVPSRPTWATTVNAYLEPGYVNEHNETIDTMLRTTTADRQAILQRYRLGLEADVTQALVLSAIASFTENSTWATTNGLATKQDQPFLGLVGQLSYTAPVLSAGAQYSRNQQWGTFLPASLVSENVNAFTSWQPFELPQIDLNFSRGHGYDVDRRTQDVTSTSVAGSARYAYRGLDLRYTLNWGATEDSLNLVNTTSLDQVLQATYSGAFLEQRLATYATATIQPSTTTIEALGSQGTVTRQRLPIGGLSLVEIFPATPTQSTLSPNPAIIDGNTTQSAGINIGYGPSLAGDRNLRHVGVQFADEFTSVNTLYLWVDRRLTSDVVAALASGFTAYRSSDNVNWIRVPVTGPVVFAPFQNRFEVTIPETRARYLKLVTAPLAPGITSDPAYADFFVTELQTLLVQSAAAVPSRFQSISLTGNGSARLAILRVPNLDYDLSITFNRTTDPGVSSFTMTNGLSFATLLGRVWGVSARVARLDSDQGQGRNSQWQWTASLSARPLPTAIASLSYSGLQSNGNDLTQLTPVATQTIQHTLGLFGRADLYEGVSFQANVSGSSSLDANQRATTVASGSGTLALVPNPWASLNANFTYSNSWASGGFLPDSNVRAARLDATLIFNPFPALTGSATAGWDILAERPTLLATFQLVYSPLRGDLQLGLNYSRTLNTASETVTQVIYPSVRWSIRPGVYLNASYSFGDTTSPILETRSRTFTAYLIITI